MKWAYDLCGAEPIIRDEVAYDAATIALGEMVMLATGDFTAGTGQGGVISAYSTTVGTAHAVDALGISLETKTTADTPSIATATDTTAEPCYVKTIINPFAVYRAECVTSQEAAITSWATTHLVVAGTASVIDSMCWVYFSATGGPNFGELRLVMNTFAIGTVETAAAPKTTATTADKVIFIAGKTSYSNPLDATAVGVSMVSTGTAFLCGATNLRVVEAWVDKDAGLEVMKQSKHYSTTAKKANGKPAKFYNDIMMKDHAYGVQEN